MNTDDRREIITAATTAAISSRTKAKTTALLESRVRVGEVLMDEHVVECQQCDWSIETGERRRALTEARIHRARLAGTSSSYAR